MKCDELSNRATENWAQDYWSLPMSSALDLFVAIILWLCDRHKLFLYRYERLGFSPRSLLF
jgi:hypothetical protein